MKKKLIFAGTFHQGRRYVRDHHLEPSQYSIVAHYERILGLSPSEWEVVRVGTWYANPEVAKAYDRLKRQPLWTDQRSMTEYRSDRPNGDQEDRVSDVVDDLLYHAPNVNQGGKVMERAADEISQLRSQLPEEMQNCTIRFLECPNGHGRLWATNWKDHGCPICEIESLQAAMQAVIKAHRDSKNQSVINRTFPDEADRALWKLIDP